MKVFRNAVFFRYGYLLPSHLHQNVNTASPRDQIRDRRNYAPHSIQALKEHIRKMSSRRRTSTIAAVIAHKLFKAIEVILITLVTLLFSFFSFVFIIATITCVRLVFFSHTHTHTLSLSGYICMSRYMCMSGDRRLHLQLADSGREHPSDHPGLVCHRPWSIR